MLAVKNKPPTNGVHGVRRQLKDTIKYESAALEEDVAPVPPIVFYDIVRLRFDPEIESD